MFSEEVQNVFYVLVPPVFALVIITAIIVGIVLVVKKFRKNK